MMQWKITLPALMLSSVFATAAVPALDGRPDLRLVQAAKSGDQSAVELLLRAHVPVDSTEGDGATALHWAAYQNNLAIAEDLLNAHANPGAVTRLEGLAPLYMACQAGSAPMIELLLKHGAKVDQLNSLGTTPLMIAAASGNTSAVEELIAHGANVNLREDAHEQTALMFAANLNRSEAIRVLIAHGADPNATSKVTPVLKMNFEGGNFAVAAAPAGDKASTEKSGAKLATEDSNEESDKAKEPANPSESTAKTTGADVKSVSPGTGDAAAKARKAMYRDRGAKFMGGMTPLLYAARQGNIAAAQALLDGGAIINEVSGSEHTTPLLLAIVNGHLDLAKMLVEHGADVNLANDMGVTPLYATIDVKWVPYEWSPEPLIDQENTKYLDLMTLLLAHGENPNARLQKQVWSRVLSENRNWIDPSGATAFWRAAQADDVVAMKLLKAGGADPRIPSKQGTTPLMVAAGLGWSANYSTTAPTRLEAIKYCMSLDANVNAHDDLGYTPLHGAAFVGDLTDIQYLVDQGAKVDAKTKDGDTVADMANGPFEKSLPIPAAVALLEKLGSTDSHNCRSSDCVPSVKADPRPVVASAATPKSTIAANSATK